MTTETKVMFTPGPWRIAPNGMCVFSDGLPEGVKRGVAHCGMQARSEDEIAANVQLVASAPDLYAACDGVDAFLRGEDDSEGIPDGWESMADHEPITVTLNARTVRAIKAALRRAEGGAG